MKRLAAHTYSRRMHCHDTLRPEYLAWQAPHTCAPEFHCRRFSSSMVPCDSNIVSAAGFEKTLRSTNESLFITNHSADTIERVLLHIEYLDTSGRQLHSRREYLGVNLPPASTRKVDIKSFDRQGVFYYHLSGHPAHEPTPHPSRCV